MARRVALAILFSVWATLIAGGAVAYIATRSVLLADLDASLIARARSLPELSGQAESAVQMSQAIGDRYVISNYLGQTTRRQVERDDMAPLPRVAHADWSTLGNGHYIRTLTLTFTSARTGKPVTVVYSGAADRFQSVLDRLAMALSIFGLAAGVLGAGVAAAVSRAALAPLRQTADVIGAIDERRLDRRIDCTALPAELQGVAVRLNEMLGRLHEAFAQRKQFLADASHELRTPVSALVTTIEVALRRPRDAAELTRILRTCLTDARMLRQLVQTLLEQARAEIRSGEDEAESFDVVGLVDECCDVADGLALDKSVQIRRALPEQLTVFCAPTRLRSIVMNLLGNAVEYNRLGGSVEVCIEAEGTDLHLTVRDTGRGIAPEHLPHVFQPFYRVGPAADEDAAPAEAYHVGLGLFLVDSHVKTMRGTAVIDSQLGIGTTVKVRLPGVVRTEAAVLSAALL